MNINNLSLFIQNGNNEQVKSFLQNNGIDIKDEFGRSPLLNAALYNNVSLMRWLLKEGADINLKDNNGYTALHFAAQEAHNESLSLLLANNASVNAIDTNGNTPAWICIMHWKGGKNLNNLKLLYQNNADLSIKNKANKSAKEIIPEKIILQLSS